LAGRRPWSGHSCVYCRTKTTPALPIPSSGLLLSWSGRVER